MQFHCNGAECWKSYKAAKVALSNGFTTVYWFRGGFPGESSGLAVESSPVTTADATKSAAAPVPSAPAKSR
jgi:hypothetical protein